MVGAKWSHCCRSGKTGRLYAAMRDIRGAKRPETQTTTMIINIIDGAVAVKATRPERVGGVEPVTHRTGDLVVDGCRRRLCAHGTHAIRPKEINRAWDIG